MRRLRSRAASLIVAFAAAIAGLGLSAPPAFADSYTYMTETSFVVKATGYCLDSNTNGLGNGVGAVYTLPCNGGDYQKWDIYIDQDVPMRLHIVDKATGRCLDSNYNGAVYALPCNGGSYQTWLLFENTQTYSGVTITDDQTSLNIDANGAGVNVRGADAYGGGNSYQTFTATAPDSYLVGFKTFKNAQYNTCLDSNSNGNVYDIACNGGGYQQWLLFYHLSTGYYTLVDNATARCLDSNGSAQAGKGAAYTLPCNGGLYQAWSIWPNSLARTGMAIENAQTTLWLAASGGVHTSTQCYCAFQAWWWNQA